MPQPPDYNPINDYTDWQTNNPTDPIPGPFLDADYNAVSLSINSINANLVLIQRDDGALGNETVDWDQLTPAVRAAITGSETEGFGLNELDDVTLTSVADNEYLKYDAASGQWINTTEPPGGFPALNDLTDVDTTGVADQDCLVFDGASGEWVPGKCGEVSDVVGKNRLINAVPPFVNQRGNQVGLISGQYFVDRWVYNKNDSIGEVDGGVATIGGDWISINVTTANASPAASVLHLIRQPIEANNIVDFGLGGANAATVTLSFEHRHAKTGTYCVAFRNDAHDRCYVAEYTQDAADTPEWATVTLTLDTTGTWATGTNRGLDVMFTIAGESTWQTGTPNTWVDGNFLATANQVNGVDSTDNFFRIRNVQLVLGTVAGAPEWIEYSQKEQQCFYYFERLRLDTQSNEVMANGHAETASTARLVIQYAPKRTGLVTPIATNQNTFQLSYKATTANGAVGTPTFDNKGRRAMRMTLTVSSAVLTAGESVILQRNGAVDCYIDVDDELI